MHACILNTAKQSKDLGCEDALYLKLSLEGIHESSDMILYDHLRGRDLHGRHLTIERREGKRGGGGEGVKKRTVYMNKNTHLCTHTYTLCAYMYTHVRICIIACVHTLSQK